jgi:metallo-beta-lactamase family protein
MKITPFGAAGGEVTGSAYFVQTDRASLMVDCGLFQGGKQAELKNTTPAGAQAAKLNATLLTHGHLDHTGRLPLLSKAGFTGPIYATQATIEMTGLILRDSARIQAQDAEYHNRKRARTGAPPMTPLYTPADAEVVLQQLKPAPYRTPIPVAPGVQAIYVEAGHMLGSASIQLLVDEGGSRRKIVFSGDLGPRCAPILREYEPFQQADLLFLESTYGDRDHRPFQETVDQFIQILQQSVAQKGKILVPTFAVGRAQLLLSLLAWAFRDRLIEKFPIFLDSPMAIEASRIYDHHRELFDAEMLEFLKTPAEPDLSSVHASVTAQDSMKINDVPGPCMVMAGAGMCNGGRILHHLKVNLAKPDTHVLIVGYQSDGSLGRRLVNGEKVVSIFGERIPVQAQIHTLGGFSAHAGQTDLVHWFDAMAASKPRIALTHGEDMQRNALAGVIRKNYGLEPFLPALGEAIDVVPG